MDGVRIPAIVGHRGASADAPENTLAAFRLAWRQRADGVELDVRLSGDGEVVVVHDASTGRCSAAGRDLVVADADAATLAGVLAGAGRDTGIPRLAEVLAAAPPGSRLLIEIKSGPETVPPLARLLDDATCARLRIALISFRLDNLLACRRALPALPCCPVFSRADGSAAASDAGADVDAWFALATEHGFSGLDPDYRDIDAAFMRRARAAKLDVFCWTVNDVADARRLAALGVDVITSDRPAALRAALLPTGNAL